MSLKALSDYTFYSRYSRFNQELNRRETWEESVKRVFDMHRLKYKDAIDKYPELLEEINFAESQQKKKRVLASQRSLQFGGEPILKKNLKIYNCTSVYIDRPRVFQEIMYVLLCGCGVGFSVQKHHVNKLPKIISLSGEEIEYIIDDSIEGWADAVGVLMTSYFETKIDNEFFKYSNKKVNFNFSKIRPEGALISGQFKAPGPNGLKKSLIKIQKLIERRLSDKDFDGYLRPIDVYDIVMHISDAVISGGIRRSATLAQFSHDDEEMMSAKSGKWFDENPQRGRSNNSAVLVKGEVSKEEFSKLMKKTREFGEPGFVWCSDKDIQYNPCLPAWASILTPNGIRKLEQINIGDIIWSETGWVKVSNKWSTGIKEVYKYSTTAGAFYGTENHRIVSNGNKIKVKDAISIDRLIGEFNSNFILNSQDIMDGLVFGDGGVHKASNNLVNLYIGEKDQDYFDSEVKSLIKKHRPGISPYAYEVETTISYLEVPKTYNRFIPDRFFYGDRSKVASFLRGLYSANGSIVSGRITLKASSFKVIEQVQQMLSFLGIESYYTTNRASMVAFNNGDFLCKESYDLNISKDREKFINIIGFIQKYKTEKVIHYINNHNISHKNKISFDIVKREYISTEEVFDITVDNITHTFWSGGLNVSNCVEIGMYPKDINGNSGWSACNLTEINGKFCSDIESFLQACRASAIIGTLQAGYTSLPYLGDISESIFKKEALLGCSITGIMDNPKILLNPEIQKIGAEEIKKVNKHIAKLIGINPAARTTCVKPAGSTSCILGTASGIHPHHAKRYLRRVQSNKSEFCLNVFEKENPLAVEESVWSVNKTDKVISFLCEVPPGGIIKNQVGAIELLEKVRLTQQNWVEFGTNKDLCIIPKIRHNVSNTIVVKSTEWEDVEKFIFENQEWFAGISLLSASGDLDYSQAPFTTVLTPNELVREYGDASILASGLIVDGLKAFDNNLWKACDTVLDIGEVLLDDMKCPDYPTKRNNKDLALYFLNKADYDIWFNKKDWVRRVKQFSERYFENDLKKATYCLKHVSLWKTWCDLKREYKDINWADYTEEKQEYVNADTLASQACSGGACEII